MPQYYTGLNPATAASDGLMAGYEFVERIRNRRRALELQERQMGLAENADRRAEDSNTRAQAEFDYTSDRRVVEDKREDRDDAFTVSERTRALGVRDEVEGARRTLAGSMDIGSAGPTSLSAIGAAGTQRGRAPTIAPTATQANVPQTEQPQDVRQTEQSGPVDLRAAQRDLDNAPGFVDKVKAFAASQQEGAKTRTAESFWGEVANPKSGVGTSYHAGIGHSVPIREVRLDPAKYSEQYLKDRSRVPAEARASLDLTMSGALKERRQALAAEGNTRAVSRIDDQISQLAKSVTSSAALDGGITRPVKVDDTRVVPAITAAAAKAREAQPMLEATPTELRAATTVVSRIGTAKRLNEKQISALTTLYAHGQIGAEELNNWSKFGTPIAPKQATVQALGGGMAAIVSEQGISFVNLGTGGGKGETDGSRSQRRLLVNDRLKQIEDGMKGMVEAGSLSDGSPNEHFNKFLQILKREAPNLQLRSGIPLLGPEGELNLSETDPGELAETLEMYRQYDEGEVQPWFFKGGKTMTEYAPEGAGEEIIDLTSAFQ